MRKDIGKLSGLASALLLLSAKIAAKAGSLSNALESGTVILAVALPFVVSLAFFLFYNWFKSKSAHIGVATSLVCLVTVASLQGSRGSYSIEWVPSLGISFGFYVDGLSLLIASLAAGIGALVFMYSHGYMENEFGKRKYYTALLAFMGSMIGLVFSSNLVLMFVFWEATSICSYFLISHYQKERSLLSAKKSLLLTVGSGMMLLAGLVILGDFAGTYSVMGILENHQTVVSSLQGAGLYLPVMVLMWGGAAAKSAQIPLHIWLPDAMEAPTPVSAFLHSATMVKAGIYLLARFRSLLIGDTWMYLFVALGLLTMTVAALLAVSVRDIKGLLAYSTASHLGLIVAALGLNSVIGVEAAGFHVLNHAVFKAALFMTAGIVAHEVGTRNIDKLSGLKDYLPLTAAVATIAGLSMAGVPPLNGFYSKELLFEATFQTAVSFGGFFWILPAVAVLGSVFTVVYSLKFISIFYGDKISEAHRPPSSMLLPPVFLAFLLLLMTVFPNRAIDLLVEPALTAVSHKVHGFSVHLPHKITPWLAMSCITLVLGVFAYSRLADIEQKTRKLLSAGYITPNYWYSRVLDLNEEISRKLVDFTETGLLRTYLTWILLTAITLALTAYSVVSFPDLHISAPLPVTVVLATAIIGCIAVVRAPSYISAVLTLSILGFMVSIYYLLANAPDLVLTQLVVETLSLTIFLLILDRFPEMEKDLSYLRASRDAILSVGVGITVFASVVLSTAGKTPAGLANYFIEKAIPGSGGSNVVNVILVDFRGLDTMGEISVIAMAGLAILMLFKNRGGDIR